MWLASSTFEKLFSAALGSRNLGQNIRAVCVFFNHAANAANLSLDAAEPIEQVAFFLVVPMFGSAMTTAGFFFITHAFHLACGDIIYPLGVFVNMVCGNKHVFSEKRFYHAESDLKA